MAEFPKLTLTEKAIEMIAESQLGGVDLAITKVKLGDGVLPDGTDITTMRDVIVPRMTAPITSYDNDGNGQMSFRFVVGNDNLDTGFFCREIGIFAKLADESTEYLYAYTNAGNKCDWIPDKRTPLEKQIIDAVIVIGNAQNVTANITDIGELLKEAFDEHNADMESHPYFVRNDKKFTLQFNGRLRKSESYADGVWTINFPQAFDCESVVVTPELYGAVSAEIPSFAILEKTSKYCKVKVSAPSEGLSWVAVGRTLDDVIKYGSFSYGAGAKIGH